MPRLKFRTVLAALLAPSVVPLAEVIARTLLQSPMVVEPERHAKLLGVTMSLALISYGASAMGLAAVAVVMRGLKSPACGARLVPLGAGVGAVLGLAFNAVFNGPQDQTVVVAALFAALGLGAAIVVSAVFVVLAGLPWSARGSQAQGEAAA